MFINACMIFNSFFICFSLDPTRLLLTFGASTAMQDTVKGNTALHYAIETHNILAVSSLVISGANLDIANKQVFHFLK